MLIWPYNENVFSLKLSSSISSTTGGGKVNACTVMIFMKLIKLYCDISDPWVGVQDPWVGPICSHSESLIYFMIFSSEYYRSIYGYMFLNHHIRTGEDNSHRSLGLGFRLQKES